MRITIWLITAAALFVSIVFARLLYAPLDLDFAKETLVENAARYLPGWEVSFDSAVVGWDWTTVRPWLTLKGVGLVDRRNRLDAHVREMRAVLTAKSFATGISVAELTIDGANVNITDLAAFSDATDGSIFDALFADGKVPRPEVLRPITEAFNRFTARLLTNAPGIELVTLNTTNVVIARGDNVRPLEFSMRHLLLRHDKGDLELDAQVDALIAGVATPVHVLGVARPNEGTLALNLSFSNLAVSSFAKFVSLPEAVSYLQVPLGIDIALDMTSIEGLRRADFNITLGEGVLSHAEHFPASPAIDYGLMQASYSVDEALLTMNKLELSLNGRVVQGTGTMFWKDGYNYPGFRLNLAADEISVEDTKDFWPVRYENGVERGARAWISQNMIKGMATGISLQVSVDPDGKTPFREKSLYEVTFEFKDIDTRYLKTMPPITGVSGRAILTNTAFDILIDKGSIEEMPIGGSMAHLIDINKPGKGFGEFELVLKGTVTQVLDLVRNPPVRIGERLKLDLARLSGETQITAKFKVPLQREAAKGSTRYDITAHIQNAGMKDLLGGSGFEAGDVTLELSNDDLLATGSGVLNGVPVDLSWREHFQAGRLDPVADTTTLVISANVDEADLQALGVNTQGFIKGRIPAEATFLGRNLKFRVGYFSADGANATMQIPQIGWEKPSGSTANINGTILFMDGGLRLDPLSVKGEDIDLRAVLAWNPNDAGPFRATIAAPKLGRNIFDAEIEIRSDGMLLANVTANTFDLKPLLSRDEGVDALSSESGLQRKGEADTATKAPATVFSLNLKAENLLLLNDVNMQNSELMLDFKNGEPQKLEFSGTSAGGKTVAAIVESSDVMRPLSVVSTDGGALLRGLGLFAHFGEGALTLDGEVNGWGPTLEMQGTLRMRDTYLVAKNRLGPLVTEGVVSGVDDYLDDGILTIGLVDFPFTYKNDLLDLTGVKVNGPTIGLTAEGQLETKVGQININGVIVPVYGLNSLLGKLPLIGGLFTGGDGKGLFGVTYRVIGSTDAPEIQSNPLSALAPGFLRLLFEGQKGTIADLDKNTLKAQKPAEPEENGKLALPEAQKPGSDDGKSNNEDDKAKE